MRFLHSLQSPPPLVAYPTLSRAAALLAVSPSTLSRREDLEFEAMGERDKRIPGLEVLRLATVFRKRPLQEVAADLVAYAHSHAPASSAQIEASLTAHVERLEAQLAREREFLAEARRSLPRALYREVEQTYRAWRAADLAAGV